MASVAPSEGRVAARGISPPKSTVSPAAVAGRVAPSSWSNVDVGSLFWASPYLTVASAIVPSFEIDPVVDGSGASTT